LKVGRLWRAIKQELPLQFGHEQLTSYGGLELVRGYFQLIELKAGMRRAFSTELFERYQRSERGLVAALAEMYVQGVSTRKIKAITDELCGHSFSASSISTINKRLDQSLAQFAARPLSEALPLYLQHSNDLSKSGRDRPSFPEVFKTVGSAWSSRPDKKRRARTVARVDKPVSRKDGRSVGENHGKSGVRWHRCV
jgi:hypothetical protein